jgi:hypothetical protein
VDSCYAGGFNDSPYFSGFMRNKKDFSHKNNRVNASVWMQEIGEDLRGKGRVVLMACREDELSYAGVFTPLLIEGLTGYADANDDKIVSAEEAFKYVEDNIETPGFDQHPTIFDNFPSELQLTEVELPPSVPEAPIGHTLGDTNTTYNYSTVSIDPEGGKISYGWDWDSDYIVDEWTDFVESNITVNISRSWEVERTYTVRVKAKDERGVLSDWSKHTIVIMCDDNTPDQYQREIDYGCWINYCWVAQSFAPSKDTLSKVELVLESFGQGEQKPLQLFIRDNLTGNNLAESSLAIVELGFDKWAWYTFDFEDIDVIPGETYYIICKGRNDWEFRWKWKKGDPYTLGEIFWSEDGQEWHAMYRPDDADSCFTTWSKI